MNTNIPFNSCVMGGSYDPPTAGHYHLIKKASTIFDCVYVILAENATKKAKSMFTDEERIAMLNDMAKSIDPSGNKVKVMVSPPSMYLANLANKLGAKFLIRGVRDQIDFGYEQNIYRTNRLIQPQVETLYLMPDDAYSLVSSSWIKSLIGCSGWTDVIKGGVTPFVLNELKKKYLEGKFFDLFKTHPLNDIDAQYARELWGEIVKSYGQKSYHGFDHLIHFFDGASTYIDSRDTVMDYSIFMHDIRISEQESAELATANFSFEDKLMSTLYNTESLKNKVTRLIMATTHNTCEYVKEDEQIIASLDLRILASSVDEYIEYSRNVFDEYWKMSGKTKEEFIPLWKKGRSEMLQKMLARRVIFPWKKMKHMETPARCNIKLELDLLNEGNVLWT